MGAARRALGLRDSVPKEPPLELMGWTKRKHLRQKALVCFAKRVHDLAPGRLLGRVWAAPGGVGSYGRHTLMPLASAAGTAMAALNLEMRGAADAFKKRARVWIFLLRL